MIGQIGRRKIVRLFLLVSLRNTMLIGLTAFLIFWKDSFGATRFAGDFLDLGYDSRSLAMGSAYVTLADNAAGAYFNPACLSMVSKREITLMHSEMFGGLEKYDVAGASIPREGGVGYGFALLRLAVDGIKFTQLQDPMKELSYYNRPEVYRTRSSADYVGYLSAGKIMRSGVSLGMTMKLLKRMVAGYEAFGFGLDIGCLYQPVPWFRLGAAVRDITRTSIHWNKGGTDNIESSFRFGMSVSRELATDLGRYTIACDADFGKDRDSFEGFESLNLGLEYVFREVLAGRVGSHKGNMTAGVGLLKIRYFKISSIDYAFLAHDELNNTHRVSLSIKW